MALFRAARFTMTRSWGMLLLGVWLILYGLLPLLKVDIPATGLLLPLLAIVAGLLILIQR